MSKQAEREYALKIDPIGLFNKPYTDPRTLGEYAIVLDLIRQAFRKGKILDLGCGPGWTSIFLARAHYDVVGVDISEKMIDIARERNGIENTSVRFVVGDMENLDLGEHDFDGAMFFDCLHHCPNYRAAIRGAWEHLRPGGLLWLMETTWLHRYSPHARHTTEKYGITELGFSRWQLRRALRQAGFTRITQHHAPNHSYRGLGGFLWSNLRLWCEFLSAFPRMKNIFVAQK